MDDHSGVAHQRTRGVESQDAADIKAPRTSNYPNVVALVAGCLGFMATLIVDLVIFGVPNPDNVTVHRVGVWDYFALIVGVLLAFLLTQLMTRNVRYSALAIFVYGGILAIIALV